MSNWFALAALLLATPSLAQPAVAPASTAPSAAAEAPAVAPALVKARKAILKKQWKVAHKLLAPLVASDPDNGDAQATLGHVLMLRGKAHYAASLEHFTIAAKLLPNSPEVHYGRGAIYQLLGQPREAKKEQRWLIMRGQPLGPWLSYVIQDNMIPEPLRGIQGLPMPVKKLKKRR
jgi:predicted Zn-dependent protease